MSDPKRPEFDQYADRYESDLRGSIPAALAEDRYFAEYKVLHVSRRLDGRQPRTFLDFGCGIGRSLCLVNEHFPGTKLWGYDVSSDSIALARERAGMANLTSNLDELPAGSFDVVFAANVFHHIPLGERVQSLAMCKRLLASGGRLFVFEHNPLNPVTRSIFERCPYDADAVMVPRREMFGLAEKAGLQVVRSDYTLFFPRQLSLLRPLEAALGWLPLGAQYCVELAR
jgi:SAM-dependent methyltransferase